MKKHIKKLTLFAILLLFCVNLFAFASTQDKKVKMNGEFPNRAGTIVIRTTFKDIDSSAVFLKKALFSQDITIARYDTDIHFMRTDEFEGTAAHLSLVLKIKLVVDKEDDNFINYVITPYFINKIQTSFGTLGFAASSTPSLIKLLNIGNDFRAESANYHLIMHKLFNSDLKAFSFDVIVEPKK